RPKLKASRPRADRSASFSDPHIEQARPPDAELPSLEPIGAATSRCGGREITEGPPRRSVTPSIERTHLKRDSDTLGRDQRELVNVSAPRFRERQADGNRLIAT